MNVQHTWAAAAAVATLVGTTGLAAPTVVFADGPGNTQGGIFHAASSANGNFDTFCAEVGEGLTLGFTYEYTISTDIVFNGNGTTNPLNSESAFIFTKFVDGEIRSILGKPLLPEDKMADAVQLAIWKVEGERDTVNPDAVKLIAAAQAAIGGGTWSGLGNVRVMNNWNPGHVGDPANSKQDTLLIVPLPPAAGLAGFGVALLAIAPSARSRRRA